jgi:hypothetical protein
MTSGLPVTTLNAIELESGEFGLGLPTAICSVPAWAMSARRIEAVSCSWLTNVVGRADPLQTTMELGLKLDPITVSVRGGLPATAAAGEIEVIAAGVLPA